MQSVIFQLLWSLCWSRQSQWRWQDYHVQAQSQSPIFTNKMYKNTWILKTWVLTREQFEDFRQKKNRHVILDFSRNPNGTPGP